MKICYINYISPSIIHGGAERVVLREAEMMTDRGNEVVIVSLRHAKSSPSVLYLYDGKIKNLLLPYVARFPTSTLGKGIDILSSVYNPLSIFYLRKVLALERPDIVHVHQLGTISLCALKAIKQLRFKIIQTFHGYYFDCPLGSLYRRRGALCDGKPILCRVYEKFYSRFKDCYDLIIAISPHIAERLEKLGYDNDRVKLIPNSVTNRQPSRLSGKREAKEILFVGRMTKSKGTHILIEALSRVKGNYVANLIGTGEDLPYFKSLAKRLGVKARFLGSVSDETLAQCYGRADVVVVPSLFPEVCCLVILEAMSYGKPVIATNLGGNPYLVHHNETGYLFDAGNENELADFIDALISNRRTALKMGVGGLDLAKGFSDEVHAKLLMNAYREVLEHGKSD